MPTSIPYDSSLVLGSIVPPEKLKLLQTVGEHQSRIDAAQEKLNSFISLRYSLDATRNELMNMRIDPKVLAGKIELVDKKIDKAAENYATASVEGNDKITEIRLKALNESVGTGNKIDVSHESPLDYNRTELKKLPLSSNSLKMDSQYFSFDVNHQSSTAAMAAIKNFVSNSTQFLGVNQSEEIGKEATNQVAKQREAHNVTGTLVVSVNCTHKEAAVRRNRKGSN